MTGVDLLLAAGYALTAALLGARRGARGAVGFAAFYAPQLAVVAWAMHAVTREVSAPAAMALTALLLAGCALVFFHRITTYALPLPPTRFDLVWVVPTHVFQTAMLFWLPIWPASRLASASPTVDLAALLGPLGVSALLLARTHRRPDVRTETLPVRGLARGVRVVQVSDLHVGPYMGEARLQALAREIDALGPELLAFTGDFLTLRSELDYGPLLRFVERLERPRLGMYGCLGNHDLAVAPQLVADLAARGLRILVDEAERVPLDGAEALWVVGLNWLGRSHRATYAAGLQKALAGADPDAPALVLAHDPAAFDHLGDGWRGLMLSGHLHGGQIGLNALGWPVSVLRPFGLYDQGAFHRGAQALYAHRGTGVYGFPVRVGVPAEVVALELVPEAR